MSKNKKGFTLVEVLVVILVSGLVLSMVATAMIFVTNSSGDLIHQAEDIDMAKNIEKYVRSKYKEQSDVDFQFDYDGSQESGNTIFKIDTDGNLIENNEEKVIFSDTGLENFRIYSDDVFTKCYMKFDSGKEFTFTLSIE